ncbi:MAG: N-acetylmuramic acid 6-phosphate etherase [Sarcina sp.]
MIMLDIKFLGTEKRNEKSLNIDLMDVRGIIEIINNEDKTVAFAIEKELDSIEAVVKDMVEIYKGGGRIVYMGAGTSGRLAVVDSVECPPTYGIDPERIVALMAGGERAFVKAVENAEDNWELGRIDLEKINFAKNDYLLGIAASGRTPYVLGGLAYAKELGAKTGSLSCNKGSEISEISNRAIEIAVGPEVVTGSTRMKAGTAQKLVLSMMSTTLMVSVGKVYSNLMVDVKITNKKLEERAVNIVIEVTGCERKEAVEKLRETNGHAKTAIVMILLGISYEDAKAKLIESDGFIRKL